MGELAVKNLEGHVLAGPGVAGLVDGAPAAPAQNRPELVVGDRLAGEDTLVGPDRGTEGRLLRLHQLLGIGDRRGIQLHPSVADLELLAVLQGVLLDLLPADERPVDAVPVGQQELASLASQLAMEPTDGPVRQPRVGLLAPADRERRSLDQVEDATLVGAGRPLANKRAWRTPPSGQAAIQGSSPGSSGDRRFRENPGRESGRNEDVADAVDSSTARYCSPFE